MTNYHQRNRSGLEVLVDIAFDGGIEVCQVANEQSVDYGKMWKIRWEPGQYDQVHVHEFQRISQFTLTDQPISG